MNLKALGVCFVLTLALLAPSFVTPTTADHIPVVSVSLGVDSFDFNDDNGSFEASLVPPPPPRPPPSNPSWEHGEFQRGISNPSWAWGGMLDALPRPINNPSWQWGAPTSGPGVAASGANVWATNLGGTYNASECAAIMSPPIDLASATTASVSFLEWRHMEDTSAAGTGTAFDAGLLFVTNDDGVTLTKIASPTPAYGGSNIGTTARACLDNQATGTKGYSGPFGTTAPPPTYSAISADLTPFVGGTVRFLIAFGADSSVHRTGWYIDDFAVTIDSATTTEDFEADDGGFTVAATALPPANGPGAPFSGDRLWATNLVGSHNVGECSAIMSPPISIPAGSTASASFMQWRHFERTSATGTIFDAGRLFVSADGGETLVAVTTPTPAYDTGTLSTLAAACLDGMATTGSGAYAGPVGTALPPPTYSSVSANLNGYAGSTVQLIIAFGEDNGGVRNGWYIDDFAVTIDGVTTVDDFEADDGGFTVGGVRPKTGPTFANSGTHVWGTNLGGDYNNSECAALLSPPIDIPAEASTATVSFKEWHHFDRATATGTINDAGRLFVTSDGGESFVGIGSPTPAYNTGTLNSLTATCLNGLPTSAGGYGGPPGTAKPAALWSDMSADLGDYIGNSVQFVIGFGSSTATTRNGWYIDDFTVTIDGVATAEDFEADDGGFTVITTSVGPAQPKGWSHGVPSTGPGGLDPADKLWATNLDGNYGPNECATLDSPPIDLTGVADPVMQEANLSGFPATKATLRWQNFFRGSTTGAAVVQIGTSDGSYTAIKPTTGYGTATPNSGLSACLGTSGSGSAFASALSVAGDPLVDYEADLSDFLGDVVTIRFVLASTSSATTQLGWYVDNVEVERLLYVGEPHLPDVPGLGANDAPLWTQGGAESSWAYGTVTDPATNSAFIHGAVGYKTNLAGNSNPNECSWIQSPALPGALFAANPTLVFEHWYRIPGTGVDVAWGGGLVQVSGDGGLTWDYLDLPEYDRPLDYSGGNPGCFTGLGAPLDGRVFSGAHHTEYETVQVDLSAYAASATVQVRFVFGTVVFNYEGWFLHDVQLGGVDLLP